jgi:PIN domain nuclease of toxin-antitoxin system
MISIFLDTCAIIFLVTGEKMARHANATLARAAAVDGIGVSPVSAWEIGMLSAKRRVGFEPDPKTWFQRFVSRPGIDLVPLTAETMIDSWLLPDWPHGDPADRILVAAARTLAVPIVTRDKRILDYAAAGHVKAIAC